MNYLEGLRLALQSVAMRKSTHTVQAGANVPYTALMQAMEAIQSLRFLNRALEAGGCKPFSGYAAYIKLGVFPVVVAIANQYLRPERHPKLCRAVQSLHQNTGGVCYLSQVVSCVACFYFNQRAFAATSLTVFGLQVLSEKQWLPYTIRSGLDVIERPTLIITSMYFGNVFEKVFGVAELALLFHENRQKNRAEASQPSPETQLTFGQLTKATCERIFSGEIGFWNLKVNPKYLHHEVAFSDASTDPSELIKAWGAMDKTAHQGYFKAKLKGDERFCLAATAKGYTADAYIAHLGDKGVEDWIKGSLETCIENIQKRSIPAGGHLDYSRVQKYLRLIAQQVVVLDDDKDRMNLLCRVAVDCGTYCGPRQYEILEEICAESCLGQQEISVEDQVILALETERRSWLQNMRDKVFWNVVSQPFWHVIRQRLNRHIDRHDYFAFHRCWGPLIGVRNRAAASDREAADEAFFRHIQQKMYGEKFKDYFNRDHEPQHLIRIMQEASGTPALPLPKLYGFFMKWASKVDSVDTGSLSDEVSTGQLFGKGLDIPGSYVRLTGRRISDEAAIAILVDMGILEIQSRVL